MVMKRGQLLKSNFQVWKNSISDSWEERAFAEDASGHLGGGCIWPPRSYSCSFCKREFRSAQALGGHMNVHRRDRARLKQSLSNSPHHQNDILQYQNHTQTHLKSVDSHFSSEFSTLDCDLDPNPVASSVVASNTLTSSRLSSLTQENLSDIHTSMSHNTPKSRPEAVKNPTKEDSTCLTNDETDFFVGLSSVPIQNSSNISCSNISYKRPKTSVSTLSFLIKPCSSDRYSLLQPGVIDEANSSSMEDIDLELRLGNPPEVK